MKIFLGFVWRNTILTLTINFIKSHGWMAMIPACHVGDRGSIPLCCFIFHFSSFFWKFPLLGNFKTPQKGLLYDAIRLGPSAFNLKLNKSNWYFWHPCTFVHFQGIQLWKFFYYINFDKNVKLGCKIKNLEKTIFVPNSFW